MCCRFHKLDKSYWSSNSIIKFKCSLFCSIYLFCLSSSAALYRQVCASHQHNIHICELPMSNNDCLNSNLFQWRKVCSEDNILSPDFFVLLSTTKKKGPNYTIVRFAAYSHALLGFVRHVFHLNCPSLSTFWVIGWVRRWCLYFICWVKRSYSPETPAGDLHALEQPRVNQVHFAAREHHKHAHIHRDKHMHAEKLTD